MKEAVTNKRAYKREKILKMFSLSNHKHKQVSEPMKAKHIYEKQL